MESKMIIAKIKEFLRGRYLYLYCILAFIIFNGIALLGDSLMGDKDLLITGNLRFAHFDINILILGMLVFACWSKCNRISGLQIGRSTWIGLVLFAGLLRFSLPWLGHNFDLESYEIVSDIVLRGDSVYEHTWRYNYAPVWAYILAGLKFLASIGGYSQKMFHELVVLVLFIGELWLYRQLYKKYRNSLLILILLFNPISVIIIGHHSQFDILAIAVGYYAYEKLKRQEMIPGLLFMGLSYCIKHLLVFLPFIFLFDKGISIRNRILILLVPAGIFALSFLPFYKDLEHIKGQVFEYQYNNRLSLFTQSLNLLVPDFIFRMGLFKLVPFFGGQKFIWLLVFIFTGYFVNKFRIRSGLEVYLVALVATSPAISEQYFLIPLAAVALYNRSIYSWIYIALASFYLMFVSYHNTARYFSLKSIGIGMDPSWFTYSFPPVQFILLLLLIQILWKASLEDNGKTVGSGEGI